MFSGTLIKDIQISHQRGIFQINTTHILIYVQLADKFFFKLILVHTSYYHLHRIYVDHQHFQLLLLIIIMLQCNNFLHYHQIYITTSGDMVL